MPPGSGCDFPAVQPAPVSPVALTLLATSMTNCMPTLICSVSGEKLSARLTTWMSGPPLERAGGESLVEPCPAVPPRAAAEDGAELPQPDRAATSVSAAALVAAPAQDRFSMADLASWLSLGIVPTRPPEVVRGRVLCTLDAGPARSGSLVLMLPDHCHRHRPGTAGPAPRFTHWDMPSNGRGVA